MVRSEYLENAGIYSTAARASDGVEPSASSAPTLCPRACVACDDSRESMIAPGCQISPRVACRPAIAARRSPLDEATRSEVKDLLPIDRGIEAEIEPLKGLFEIDRRAAEAQL
jgi:hypothetical protein